MWLFIHWLNVFFQEASNFLWIHILLFFLPDTKWRICETYYYNLAKILLVSITLRKIIWKEYIKMAYWCLYTLLGINQARFTVIQGYFSDFQFVTISSLYFYYFMFIFLPLFHYWLYCGWNAFLAVSIVCSKYSVIGK